MWLLLLASAWAADLSWMAGHWVGSEGEVVYEEHWEPALGGHMFGSFRMVKAGEPVFYELITIDAEAMRIRHFTPALEALEPKKKPLVLAIAEEGAQMVRFVTADESLLYERSGDALTITLSEGDATVATFSFTLR